MANAVHGENPVSKEYAIKAAFLYNFAKFVDWPIKVDETSNPFVVCILGDNPFGSSLEKLEGKGVRGRKFKVRYIKKAKEIGSCNIVYVSRSKRDDLGDILTSLRKQSVLTVGDMEGFAQRGGIINFVMKERKVGFEINLDASARAGLKISSKLLKLAKIVDGKNG
jgi:hypothetical protein